LKLSLFKGLSVDGIVDIKGQLLYVDRAMLKVSTRSTYGIRALTFLARSGAGATVTLAHIASTQKIPLPYLVQIFSRLRKSGLVEAIRGPQGGYRLSRASGEITLAQVVQSLEGPTTPVLCTMPENRSEKCHEVDGCVNRVLCCEIDGALNQILSNKTLASLNGEVVKSQRSA
jgi:Rrf2 family protein